MKKTVLLLLVFSMLMAAACGASQPRPEPTAEPEQASEQPDTLPALIDLEMYIDAENLHGLSLEDDDDKQIVMDAVMNAMLKSAAWPAVDVKTLEDYISIAIQYETDGEWTCYYVFEEDGAHCLQNGEDGMYSVISEDAYKPLYELAMGWHLPHTLSIQSGGETVNALRNWIWSQEDGLNADGMRLTPQQVADDIQYITYDTDFEPMLDGAAEPGIVFKLYDEDFKEVTYPIPSGLAAWSWISQAEPGKYVAVAEMSFEDGSGMSGYQYLFGLNIPDQDQPSALSPAETVSCYFEYFNNRDDKSLDAIMVKGYGTQLSKEESATLTLVSCEELPQETDGEAVVQADFTVSLDERRQSSFEEGEYTWRFYLKTDESGKWLITNYGA